MVHCCQSSRLQAALETHTLHKMVLVHSGFRTPASDSSRGSGASDLCNRSSSCLRHQQGARSLSGGWRNPSWREIGKLNWDGCHMTRSNSGLRVGLILTHLHAFPTSLYLGHQLLIQIYLTTSMTSGMGREKMGHLQAYQANLHIYEKSPACGVNRLKEPTTWTTFGEQQWAVFPWAGL